MPKYLARLWDDYSKIVLAGATKDFDAREASYEQDVPERVWNTVAKMREKREAFRNMIRAEMRMARRRRSDPPSR